MGLDWRPMGKPKPGTEARYHQLYRMLTKAEPIPVNPATNQPYDKDTLKEEWFSLQIPSYETIRAPRVGRDPEALEWLKSEYEEHKPDMSLEEFIKEYEGFYVILLAPETDGVPMYVSMGQDENVFRGKFIDFCEDIIGKELYDSAFETKTAEEALAYGQRLMAIADDFATKNNLLFLKDQYLVPDVEIGTVPSQAHILYSAAKWFIFYGKNGHGVEADW